MESMLEEMGGICTQVGDFLLPDLYIENREEYHIGKYGRMRKRYLKEYRPVLYTNLLVTGKLDQHLIEIDRVCIERMNLFTREMTGRDGVTVILREESCRSSGLRDRIKIVNKPCSIRTLSKQRLSFIMNTVSEGKAGVAL